jgi:transitional endoplasmic reticulum ATPase
LTTTTRSTSKLSLRVERAASEYAASSHRLVHLAADAVAAAGVEPGDVVEVATDVGATTLGRVAAVDGSSPEPGSVGLDRFLRRSLKVRLDERVVVRPRPVGRTARVVLASAVDLSSAHHLDDHLKRVLVESRAPLSRGAVVYATFQDSTAGTTFTVSEIDDDRGIVDEDTEVAIVHEPRSARSGDTEVMFEDVGGAAKEVAQLRELVQLPLQEPRIFAQLGIPVPRGVILYGPPGCGKTYLAKALANEVRARFYYINGPSIVGTLHGESEANLRRMFAEAAHHAPSIVLIDELDAVAPKRSTAGSQADVRLVTQLLSLMDGLALIDGVVVVATTNRIDAVEPAMRRPGRLDRELYIAPPDVAGRREILDIHTRDMPLTRAAKEHLDDIAADTHGFVGADLMELCREAGLTSLRRRSAARGELAAFRVDPVELLVDVADFQDARRTVRPSALREVTVTGAGRGWSEIGGLQQVKRRLDEAIVAPRRNADRLAALDIRPETGVLLSGPAGSGKTAVARALAAETGMNFVAVDGPEIFSRWLGESEEAVRHIFRLARQVAPAIVFFDQLDAVAPRVGATEGSRTTDRVVNQLLAEMDGLEPLHDILVVGATSRKELIEPSLLRSGRLGLHVDLPLPDVGDRVEILRLLLADVEVGAEDDKDAMILELARASEAMTAPDLRALVNGAKLRALGRSNTDGMPHLLWDDFQPVVAEAGRTACVGAAHHDGVASATINR